MVRQAAVNRSVVKHFLGSSPGFGAISECRNGLHYIKIKRSVAKLRHYIQAVSVLALITSC